MREDFRVFGVEKFSDLSHFDGECKALAGCVRSWKIARFGCRPNKH